MSLFVVLTVYIAFQQFCGSLITNFESIFFFYAHRQEWILGMSFASLKHQASRIFLPLVFALSSDGNHYIGISNMNWIYLFESFGVPEADWPITRFIGIVNM